ncbi:hypothetical protein Tco_0296852, partial [Tanacetum coccineum]
SLVFFSPSAGEAVAWTAEGTSLVVALNALSTTVANLSKFSDLGCKTRDSGSENNSVNFEGSSFSSVGKQLAKLCEAKILESSGFKEVTRRLVSWLMSGYEGLAFSEVTSASVVAFYCSSSLL